MTIYLDKKEKSIASGQNSKEETSGQVYAVRSNKEDEVDLRRKASDCSIYTEEKAVAKQTLASSQEWWRKAISETDQS